MKYTLKTSSGSIILESCTAKQGFEKIKAFQAIDRLTNIVKGPLHYILSPINK